MEIHVHQPLKDCGLKEWTKYVALALFAAFTALSCGNSTSQRKDNLKQTVLDTVLLGYRLGMPYDEMLTYSKALVDAGTISFDGTAFRYDMQLDDHQNVKASFVPMPHNNLIYKIALLVPSQGMISTPELVTMKLQLLLGTKYGLPTETEQQKLENVAESCTWIFKNARIELRQSLDGALVEYFDTAIDQQLKRAYEDSIAGRKRATERSL